MYSFSEFITLHPDMNPRQDAKTNRFSFSLRGTRQHCVMGHETHLSILHPTDDGAALEKKRKSVGEIIRKGFITYSDQ